MEEEAITFWCGSFSQGARGSFRAVLVCSLSKAATLHVRSIAVWVDRGRAPTLEVTRRRYLLKLRVRLEVRGWGEASWALFPTAKRLLAPPTAYRSGDIYIYGFYVKAEQN